MRRYCRVFPIPNGGAVLYPSENFDEIVNFVDWVIRHPYSTHGGSKPTGMTHMKRGKYAVPETGAFPLLGLCVAAAKIPIL